MIRGFSVASSLKSALFFAVLSALRRASPPCRRNYPAAGNKRLRAIHRLDNANSVYICAAFFAKPR